MNHLEKNNQTPASQLKQQLDALQQLARFQRSLRMGLRAFWLGAGGVMLGWGLNVLFGWLPDPFSWLLIGAVLALLPLVALARSLPHRSAWVWRLDRRLGLHEQISTAWGVTENEQPGRVSAWLVQDVNALLPKLRERLLRRGWFLEFDLVSALIVILLGVILVSSSLLQPYDRLLNDAPAAISAPAMPPPFEVPPPQEQPGAGQPEQGPAEGQQPGDQPGEGQQAQDPNGEGGDQPGDTSGDSQDQGAGAAEDALRQLGRQLSRQAGTYDLGQALQNMDLNAAAEALEDLNQNLDELSPESQENLAQALQEAADALQQSGEQSPAQQALAEDMRQSAQALQQQQEKSAGDALSEMAGDLRQLADEMGASQTAGGGAGTGAGSAAGSSEPLSRLDGEDGDMELPLTDPSGSALLSPGSTDANGDGIADGSPLNAGQSGDDVIQSPLLPGSFLWKWRNVVSQYFQR